MARKYKPVVLPLREVPAALTEERARCPICEDRSSGVIGRLGLRLVFRCERCRVRFYRPSPAIRFG
jgi:tRNA(Ile2) C34 agmatinyltransferase TiaS